jgi:hypothetical protein
MAGPVVLEYHLGILYIYIHGFCPEALCSAWSLLVHIYGSSNGGGSEESASSRQQAYAGLL